MSELNSICPIKRGIMVGLNKKNELTYETSGGFESIHGLFEVELLNREKSFPDFLYGPNACSPSET